MKALLTACALLAASAVQANATTIVAHAGTPGIAYTEAIFTIGSTLGPEFTVGSMIGRDVDLTGQVVSVLGAPPLNTYNYAFAYTAVDGEQSVYLADAFTSPFFLRADFSGVASLYFEGPPGSLFKGDELFVDSLTNYFVNGFVTYTPEAPAIALALPEAGTWAMMVIGLGFIGSALRRSKSVKTAVQFG